MTPDSRVIEVRFVEFKFYCRILSKYAFSNKFGVGDLFDVYSKNNFPYFIDQATSAYNFTINIIINIFSCLIFLRQIGLDLILKNLENLLPYSSLNLQILN